MIDQLGAHC